MIDRDACWSWLFSGEWPVARRATLDPQLALRPHDEQLRRVRGNDEKSGGEGLHGEEAQILSPCRGGVRRRPNETIGPSRARPRREKSGIFRGLFRVNASGNSRQESCFVRQTCRVRGHRLVSPRRLRPRCSPFDHSFHEHLLSLLRHCADRRPHVAGLDARGALARVWPPLPVCRTAPTTAEQQSAGLKGAPS